MKSNVLFLLVAMIFCHIVDDYYLQGILAKLKQRSWWKENAPDKMYKNDYKVALIEHAFSWSFMVHIPVFIYCCLNALNASNSFILIMLVQAIVHALIDDLKANKKVINLLEDQLIHMVQIFLSWMICLILM